MEPRGRVRTDWVAWGVLIALSLSAVSCGDDGGPAGEAAPGGAQEAIAPADPDEPGEDADAEKDAQDDDPDAQAAAGKHAAAGKAAPPKVEPPPLDVTGFMAAVEALSAQGLGLGARSPEDGHEGVLEEHGYDDGRFDDTFSRVRMALGALRYEDGMEEGSEARVERRRQVQALGRLLPGAGREQLGAEFTAGEERLRASYANVSEADKAAVRPHREALERVIVGAVPAVVPSGSSVPPEEP
jgi:hypothetical protein